MIEIINKIKQSTIKFHQLGTALLFVIILVFLSACSFQNYGKLAMSSKAQEAFRIGHVYPEYNYYYSGRENMPYAIVGIDKQYSVPSKFWIRFDADSAKLKKMASGLYRDTKDRPYGSDILTPDGKKIGIWYSNIIYASVKIDAEKQSVTPLYVNPELRRGH